MDKKTINFLKPTFFQAINISKEWCHEWEDELLSDEVFADRIGELINTRDGLRGFFAYTLSDINCTLFDKLPSSVLFKLREKGENIVEIVVKNFIMSSAQVINHRRDKNIYNENLSKNISERCLELLKNLDTKLVAKNINEIISKLDQMGNSFDKSSKFDNEQKSFIREEIIKISH